MTDTPIAADPVAQAAPEAPLPPFVPAPLPRSGYAEPAKVHRKVPFANPVVFEGKTYADLYLRKLTVAQVRTCVGNAVEMRARDPNAPFFWPVFVDAEENSLPDGVADLLPDDEWEAIVELSRDYIPQRFRPPPTTAETTSPESQSNESGRNTGKTTEE